MNKFLSQTLAMVFFLQCLMCGSVFADEPLYEENAAVICQSGFSEENGFYVMKDSYAELVIRWYAETEGRYRLALNDAEAAGIDAICLLGDDEYALYDVCGYIYSGSEKGANSLKLKITAASGDFALKFSGARAELIKDFSEEDDVLKIESKEFIASNCKPVRYYDESYEFSEHDADYFKNYNEPVLTEYSVYAPRAGEYALDFVCSQLGKSWTSDIILKTGGCEYELSAETAALKKDITATHDKGLYKYYVYNKRVFLKQGLNKVSLLAAEISELNNAYLFAIDYFRFTYKNAFYSADTGIINIEAEDFNVISGTAAEYKNDDYEFSGKKAVLYRNTSNPVVLEKKIIADKAGYYDADIICSEVGREWTSDIMMTVGDTEYKFISGNVEKIRDVKKTHDKNLYMQYKLKSKVYLEEGENKIVLSAIELSTLNKCYIFAVDRIRFYPAGLNAVFSGETKKITLPLPEGMEGDYSVEIKAKGAFGENLKYSKADKIKISFDGENFKTIWLGSEENSYNDATAEIKSELYEEYGTSGVYRLKNIERIGGSIDIILENENSFAEGLRLYPAANSCEDIELRIPKRIMAENERVKSEVFIKNADGSIIPKGVIFENGMITFVSDNENAACVSGSGEIFAVGRGRAKITAAACIGEKTLFKSAYIDVYSESGGIDIIDSYSNGKCGVLFYKAAEDIADKELCFYICGKTEKRLESVVKKDVKALKKNSVANVVFEYCGDSALIYTWQSGGSLKPVLEVYNSR